MSSVNARFHMIHHEGKNNEDFRIKNLKLYYQGCKVQMNTN